VESPNKDTRLDVLEGDSSATDDGDTVTNSRAKKGRKARSVIISL